MSTFPRPNSKLTLAVNTFSAQLPTVGKATGLSAADITLNQKSCASIAAAIQDRERKRNEFQSATRLVEEIKKKELAVLNGTLARMQASEGWTPALAAALGFPEGSSAAATPIESRKPRLSVKLQMGQVVLKFTRHPFAGANVYTRKRGEAAWRFLGRFQHSPCVDKTPPTTPGVAEFCEYKVHGVLRDQEVGQPSDVVVVTTDG